MRTLLGIEPIDQASVEIDNFLNPWPIHTTPFPGDGTPLPQTILTDADNQSVAETKCSERVPNEQRVNKKPRSSS